MTPEQEVVFKQTKLRNLKRRYSKIIQHPDLNEEAIDLKADIDHLERELKS